MRRGEEYIRPKKANLIIVLLYIILGVYFINYPFSFIEIPEQISGFDQWIIFAAGILMLFGAINYFRAKKRL